MILKSYKSNTPNPEAVATLALVDASVDSTFKLSKLINLSSYKA